MSCRSTGKNVRPAVATPILPQLVAGVNVYPKKIFARCLNSDMIGAYCPVIDRTVDVNEMLTGCFQNVNRMSLAGLWAHLGPKVSSGRKCRDDGQSLAVARVSAIIRMAYAKNTRPTFLEF
jgi:hypothetical protein